MGSKTNDCEKKELEDLFSNNFIIIWWFIAMGIILVLLILQCCLSNITCVGKIPPYISYIVLILLILYPLYNSITAFGINVKKGMRELSGQITNLNQMIQQNNKVIIKKKVIKYKTIIAKQEIHDKASSANFKEKIEESENTTTKIANIKAYLLVALFNAPSTIDHYYQQEIRHYADSDAQEVC